MLNFRTIGLALKFDEVSEKFTLCTDECRSDSFFLRLSAFGKCYGLFCTLLYQPQLNPLLHCHYTAIYIASYNISYTYIHSDKLPLLSQLTSSKKLHSADINIQWHPQCNSGLQAGPIIDFNYSRPATKLNREGHMDEL